MYFWKRAVPAELSPKLAGDPSELTVKDIDALAEKVYKKGLPRIGRAGAMLQYAYVLARMDVRKE